MSDAPNPAPEEATASDPAPQPAPEANNPDPAPDPAPEPKGADPEPNQDDWRAAIKDEGVRKFADKFTSPADMAADAFKARQAASRSIQRPGKDATDEEMAAFHKALGVPEKAGDYKAAIPDDLPDHLRPANDDALNDYRDFAHANNFTQEQFDANLKWYFSNLVKNEADLTQSLNSAQEDTMKALQKEWGGDRDRNIELAVRAAEELGGQDFLSFVDSVTVDGVRLGDHPDFLRPFAKMGRLMAEDNPLMGASEDQVQSLKNEYHELTGKILAAKNRNDRIEMNRLIEQREALDARFGPGQPVVGQGGRRL